MTLKQGIGAFILAVPLTLIVVGMTMQMVEQGGWRMAAFVWISGLVLAGSIVTGIMLIFKVW